MRNLLVYPLTAVEAANACESAAMPDADGEVPIGGIGPEALRQAALFIMSRAAEFEAFARVKEVGEEPPPSVLSYATDGNRPLPFDRDAAGRMARDAEIRAKSSAGRSLPYTPISFDELTEREKEFYRAMGEAVARYTLIGDAARLSAMVWPPGQEKEES